MRVGDWECVIPEFLLACEHDPNRSASKSAPDKTLGPPEPFCFSTEDQRAKCPSKSHAKNADSKNLTSTHYSPPLKEDRKAIAGLLHLSLLGHRIVDRSWSLVNCLAAKM